MCVFYACVCCVVRVTPVSVAEISGMRPSVIHIYVYTTHLRTGPCITHTHIKPGPPSPVRFMYVCVRVHICMLDVCMHVCNINLGHSATALVTRRRYAAAAAALLALRCCCGRRGRQQHEQPEPRYRCPEHTCPTLCALIFAVLRAFLNSFTSGSTHTFIDVAGMLARGSLYASPPQWSVLMMNAFGDAAFFRLSIAYFSRFAIHSAYTESDGCGRRNHAPQVSRCWISDRRDSLGTR